MQDKQVDQVESPCFTSAICESFSFTIGDGWVTSPDDFGQEYNKTSNCIKPSISDVNNSLNFLYEKT